MLKLKVLRKPPLKMLMIASTLAGLGTVIAGCATLPQPVNKPCGVISDPLKDVHATTPKGESRISAHFEKGVAAGCWPRN